MTSGLPQAFLDKIYAQGNGVFVNDTSGVLQTYIVNDYPATQTFVSLRDIYQSNFEAQLQAAGGTVRDTDYVIAAQAVPTPISPRQKLTLISFVRICHCRPIPRRQQAASIGEALICSRAKVDANVRHLTP